MQYFCGVDIGASAVKLVIIDEDARTLARAVGRSGVDYAQSANRCLADALAAAGLESQQLQRSVSTGYGRNNVPWVCNSMTEIACHAKGAYSHLRQPMTVVDIGAQDSKMIHLDGQGRRIDFKMNRKCAAGTGSFLEEIALRLDLPVAELNGLAEQSTKEVKLGSFCTVFTATEILEKIRAGERSGGYCEGRVSLRRETDPRDGDDRGCHGDDRRRRGPQPNPQDSNRGVLSMHRPRASRPAVRGSPGGGVVRFGNDRNKRVIMLIKDPPVRLTNRLWMLGTNAFPLYLYQGEREGTIFEGAVSAMGPVLDGQLRSLGVAHDTVRQVVVTHAHPDHVMAIPVFRQMFPHMQVLASEPAAQTLLNEKAVSFFCKMDGALTDWLIGSGVIVESSRQAPRAEKQIVVDRTLREGDQIDVDQGVSFRVLATPGHSLCSLSFHEPEQNVLIISDATGFYIPDQDFMWPLYLTGLSDYLQSIERLAGIGAETLCLSHNAVIRGADDVAAYFRAAIAETERYHEQIVTKAKAGRSVQEISAELGADVFERTGQLTLDFFCKNCALLAKHSLQHEGLGI